MIRWSCDVMINNWRPEYFAGQKYLWVSLEVLNNHLFCYFTSLWNWWTFILLQLGLLIVFVYDHLMIKFQLYSKNVSKTNCPKNEKIYIFEKPLTMPFQKCKNICKIINNLIFNQEKLKMCKFPLTTGIRLQDKDKNWKYLPPPT